jgi:hypothetical protein
MRQAADESKKTEPVKRIHSAANFEALEPCV